MSQSSKIIWPDIIFQSQLLINLSLVVLSQLVAPEVQINSRSTLKLISSTILEVFQYLHTLFK